MLARPPAREDQAVPGSVLVPSRSPTRGPTWGACRKPRARLPADPGGTWLQCAALRPPGPRSVCPAGPSSPRPGRVSAPPRFPHTLIWSGPNRQTLPQPWRHLAAARDCSWPGCDLWRTPGLEAYRCGAELEICRFTLPDVPTWGPRYRTWGGHKPWGFELRAPEYIFLCNMAPIQKKLSSKGEL